MDKKYVEEYNIKERSFAKIIVYDNQNELIDYSAVLLLKIKDGDFIVRKCKDMYDATKQLAIFLTLRIEDPSMISSSDLLINLERKDTEYRFNSRGKSISFGINEHNELNSKMEIEKHIEIVNSGTVPINYSSISFSEEAQKEILKNL